MTLAQQTKFLFVPRFFWPAFLRTAPLLLPRPLTLLPATFWAEYRCHIQPSTPSAPKQADNLSRELFFTARRLPSGMGHFWFVFFLSASHGSKSCRGGSCAVFLHPPPKWLRKPSLLHLWWHMNLALCQPAVSLTALGIKLNSSVSSSLSTSISFCWHEFPLTPSGPLSSSFLCEPPFVFYCVFRRKRRCSISKRNLTCPSASVTTKGRQNNLAHHQHLATLKVAINCEEWKNLQTLCVQVKKEIYHSRLITVAAHSRRERVRTLQQLACLPQGKNSSHIEGKGKSNNNKGKRPKHRR